MSFTQPGYPSGPNHLGALSDEPEEDSGKKKKKDKSVTRKVVNRQIVIAAVFAVIVAVLAGFLLLGSKKSTFVVVAAQDIAAAAKITPADLKAVTIDPESVVPGAFTGATAEEATAAAAKAVEGGSRATGNILRNQQLAVSMLGAGKVLSSDLAPTERLMAIKASVSRAVAGQITPGDTVDVLGTVSGTTGVLARQVPVVTTLVSEEKINSAADTGTDNTNGDPSQLITTATVPGLYVVRVTADQALRITAVQETGTVTLLWNPENAAASELNTTSGAAAVCGGAGAC